MEFLLLAMLVSYYMTRNTVQDLVWKARGEDPPSFRREQERIARREARRPITDKRAARAFWANAWADAWESAGERRERIHNQRMKRRHQGWDREDFEEAEDEAYDRNTREPEPQPEPEPVPDPSVPEPVADDQPTTPEPEPVTEPEPATGGAQIIQFADLKRPTTEETDMEHSGETTNLNAGLAYTQSMAATCLEGVTSVETSMANHRAGGVTGPTLDALAQAQEFLSQAAAAFQTAHAALTRHLGVQEQYAVNADAGTREFVRAD